MNLKDTILHLRRRLAIKRRDNATYFKVVRKIAVRGADRMVKEKMKK